MKNRIVPLEICAQLKSKFCYYVPMQHLKNRVGSFFYALDFCEIYGYLQIEAGIEETETSLLFIKTWKRRTLVIDLQWFTYLIDSLTSFIFSVSPREMWLHFYDTS